jgi:hypothetical protein
MEMDALSQSLLVCCSVFDLSPQVVVDSHPLSRYFSATYIPLPLFLLVQVFRI